VLADIQKHGGNPHDEECSARLTDEGWYVTAWHIMYPNNVGSSRFVPGGFTDYVVSRDGRILKTCPAYDIATEPVAAANAGERLGSNRAPLARRGCARRWAAHIRL